MICFSAATVGVAAGCGEVDKDSHHEASVGATAGVAAGCGEVDKDSHHEASVRATAGVAAGCGEVDKDSHHEASVRAAGGIFVPLVVESLGLWSPNSLAILRVIALCATSKSGASTALAFCYFIEQLSMCLWRYNSQMLLHLILLPSSPLY